MSATPWLGDERPAWLAAVTEWITAHVDGVTAIESAKARIWGAVLRVDAADRTRWFKQPGLPCRHEVRLVADLSGRWPTLVPDVIAVDLERDWLLLADHGVPMGDVLDVPGQVASIERLLPAYADLQASTAPDVPAWLVAGVPDRRLDRLPELLDVLLAGSTPTGSLHIDDDERTALAAGVPLLARVCEDLSTTSVIDALDHADIHHTNVLVAGDERRLIDWGDAHVTHPFSALFVPYELVVARLPDADDRRRATLRLRDAYLDAWPAAAADRWAFGMAVWTGHVTRAISIAHETLGEDDDQDEILGLLRSWHAKRALLNEPDEVIQPR